MSRMLQINLTYDTLSAGLDIELAPVEDWFSKLQHRNAAARAAEVDGSIPLRHWIACPHCQADATHLGAVHMDDRMVRICTWCKSLFEVASGQT